MNAATVPPSAQSYTGASSLTTIAELPATPTPAGTGISSYGPLWSFSRPVRFNAGSPTGEGAVFSKDNWSALYPAAVGTLTSSYPDAQETPYEKNAPPNRQVVSSGLKYRRVLNVPLLACPLASGAPAAVLGIGRFLMVAPATSAPPAIHAEFGGLVAEGKLASSVTLYK